jgi:hypothetical protein
MLAMVYYPLGAILFSGKSLRGIFRKSGAKDFNKKRLVLGFFVGGAIAVTLIGILFKVQLWPNSDFVLKSGLVFVTICAAAILFSYKKTSDFSNMTLKRMLFWGGIGLSAFLISNDTLIDHFYADRSEEYRQLTKELDRDPNNQEVREKLIEMDEAYYSRETD